MWIKQKIQTLLWDESGQTTTEYILILAVVITLIMQMRSRLMAILKKIFTVLDEGTTEATNEFTD